jgi:hypothetical protein
MASFADKVFQAFHDLETNHRFVPVRAGASKRFAALVRQETEDVYVYVFVHDGRSGDVNLDVDLWVAPPDEPGGGLDNLYVGYKVRIGSEYDVADAFLLNCQKRIIHFLPCVSAMVPLIREELLNPSFRTKRWTVYHIERKALSTLLAAAQAGDADSIAAVKAAKRLAKNGANLETLVDGCTPIATTLIGQASLESDVADFFDDRVKWLASSLATHLYAKALGELSALQGQ